MDALPLDQVIVGDCIEVMNRLPERCVDLIFADPPYNLQLQQELYRPNLTRVDAVDDAWDKFESFEAYDQFTTAWLTAARRVLKDTGTLWVIGTYHNIFRIGKILQDLGFWILNDVVWIKCLAGTTYVYVKTDLGERPMTIKDMVRLDPKRVKLWNGSKWVQVIGWQKQPSGECIELVLRSGERIRCTPNHLWPTQRGILQTSELQVGDVIETCRLPEPENGANPEYLDDREIGWFVGLYIAEGSRSGDTIQIASHTRETERVERLKRLAQSYHGTCAVHKTKENGCTINLNGKILNAILDTYVSGKTAQNKHLSKRCWERSNDFLKALLEGYLEGDGHFDSKNNRWRLGFTQNLQLEADMRTLCARIGVSVRLHPYNLKQHERIYPTIRGEVRFERTKHPNTKPDGEVVAIGKCWSECFWDIAVDDESHLFALASGVLTHNSNPMPNFRGVRFTNAHETLIWAQKHKGKPYTFNYADLKALNDDLQMRSDWHIPLCTGKERLRVNGAKAHATQKPEALLTRIVLATTKPGDVVLDPFLGTGTTAAVAKRLGRRWIGIERDPQYAALAEQRIAAVVPYPPEFVAGYGDERRRAPRVPFGVLVECGLIAPGTTLYFQQRADATAQVLVNGHIRYKDGTVGSIHQIARRLAGAPCNGWEHWHYRDADTDALLPIDCLRQAYLEGCGDK